MAEYAAVTEALRIATEKSEPFRLAMREYAKGVAISDPAPRHPCCGGNPTPDNPCQCKPQPATTDVLADDLTRLRSLEAAVRNMIRNTRRFDGADLTPSH